MNPLQQLLINNKGKGQPIKAMTDGDEATLYIYDAIVSDDYWGGVSAETFVKELNSLTAPTIHLRINSPGGDVFAARAMVQAIKDHKSHIVVHVDGMAASAATFLVVSADESMISEGGMFMIHNAWTIAAGNADDFLSTADLLTRIDQSLVKDYASKTDVDEEQIKQWMDDETYFFGDEAVENGFIDKVAESEIKNKIEWDLSAYKNAPSNQAPSPKPLPADDDSKPSPPGDEISNKDDVTPEPVKPDLSAHYRQLEVVQLTA